MHQAVDRRGASLTEVKEYNFSEGEGKTEGLSFNRSCVCAQCLLKRGTIFKNWHFQIFDMSLPALLRLNKLFCFFAPLTRSQEEPIIIVTPLQTFFVFK